MAVFLIVFWSILGMAAEEKNLVLGEEWILRGNRRLWVSSEGLLTAKPRGTAIVIKGKKEGVTEIRHGDRSVVVRVVRPSAMRTHEALSRRAGKTAGLDVGWFGTSVAVDGRLYSMSDYRKLTADLPADARWVLRADVPSRMREEFERELVARVGTGAPVRPLVYEETPTALFNGAEKDAARWSATLGRWGVALRREKGAVDIAPVVRVEIAVAEIRRDKARALGIGWPASFDAKLLADGKWTGEFPFSAQAFEAEGYGRLLARPNVLCRSGKEAEFMAGGEFPIKVVSLHSQGVIWKKYGIVLKVKPKADASGRISLGIETEVSTIDGSRVVDGIPGLRTNRVASHFDLARPRTVVLSGLLKNEDSVHHEGLPGLSGLPILGPLFGSENWRENKTELVVFVRPSIVEEDQP